MDKRDYNNHITTKEHLKQENDKKYEFLIFLMMFTIFGYVYFLIMYIYLWIYSIIDL